MILIKLFLIFNLITYRVILQTFPEMIWKKFVNRCDSYKEEALPTIRKYF